MMAQKEPDDHEPEAPGGADSAHDTAEVSFAAAGADSSSANDDSRTARMKTRAQLVIGGFPVAEKLGEGGMGIVYRAFDPDLHRTVAIKKMHPRLAGDEEFARRFLSEARAIAAVSHANIAQIFAIHAHDRETPPFFVMEFIDGPSVEARVRANGPLAPDAALDITLQAARGLRAAHRQGLIHRDVKPSNVLLTQRGEAKLVDFGLARQLREDELGRQSEAGVVLGTPHYLSPEQARGWAVDQRSDIYSLGCTLYYMLCGEEPFSRKDKAEVVVAHLEDAPPIPSHRHRSIPREIDALILKMLAKRPEDRHQQYDELIDDLARVQRELAMSGQPARRTRRVPLLATFVAMATVGAALWLGASYARSLPGTPTPRELFGDYYIESDGRRGEGLFVDFGDEGLRDHKTPIYQAPQLGLEDPTCREPYVRDGSLRWENYRSAISFPYFQSVEEVEITGLRFRGRPDFELSIGYDPDRPGSVFSVFFGVMAENTKVARCYAGGEEVEVVPEGNRRGQLRFTLEESTDYTLRLARTGTAPAAAEGAERAQYLLTIVQQLRGVSEQERARYEFSVPAAKVPAGCVALRADGITSSWMVSLREILIRGAYDNERNARALRPFASRP